MEEELHKNTEKALGDGNVAAVTDVSNRDDVNVAAVTDVSERDDVNAADDVVVDESDAVAEDAGSSEDPSAGRRSVLYIVAGAYLVYLAYQMLSDLIPQFSEGVTGKLAGMALIAVVFAGIGIFVLVMGIRNMKK